MPRDRYRTCAALRRVAEVSSTCSSAVVSNELSAPPLLIARATAAMDRLSGARTALSLFVIGPSALAVSGFGSCCILPPSLNELKASCRHENRMGDT